MPILDGNQITLSCADGLILARRRDGGMIANFYSLCGTLLKLALRGLLEMAEHPHRQPWMEQTQTGKGTKEQGEGKRNSTMLQAWSTRTPIELCTFRTNNNG